MSLLRRAVSRPNHHCHWRRLAELYEGRCRVIAFRHRLDFKHREEICASRLPPASHGGSIESSSATSRIFPANICGEQQRTSSKKCGTSVHGWRASWRSSRVPK